MDKTNPRIIILNIFSIFLNPPTRMSVKLLTIGDSISQGFMSGAAARTDLSYSTLVARKLGITDYTFPDVWKQGGHPLNLENILRALNNRYGSEIRGVDWLTVLQTISHQMDLVENYYERGDGRATNPTGLAGFYHNLAVRGFTVADAWQVTAQLAFDTIQREKGRGDGWLFGLPDESFHRTALRVLNPNLDPEFMAYSQLDWLRYHATRDGGVENIFLWLGANNALGTVLSLTIKPTPGVRHTTGKRPVDMSYQEREEQGWNLWHPDDFRAEYQELIDRTEAILADNEYPDCRVFVATVPLVTIAPLAKGVGPTTPIKVIENGESREYLYFKYYTYFPFDEEFAHKNDLNLNLQQALLIDNTIRAYNRIIQEIIGAANAKLPKQRYFVVDIARNLSDLALKRNDFEPRYALPSFFEFISPQVDTKYYHADRNGQMKQGGIFSLDGVHPSAIGHGLLAYEFLKTMIDAQTDVDNLNDDDWRAIFDADDLYNKPISMMAELYEHDQLIEFILRVIQVFRSRKQFELFGNRAPG